MQQIAERYLDPSRMTILVVGEKKVIADELKPYGIIVE